MASSTVEPASPDAGAPEEVVPDAEPSANDPAESGKTEDISLSGDASEVSVGGNPELKGSALETVKDVIKLPFTVGHPKVEVLDRYKTPEGQVAYTHGYHNCRLAIIVGFYVTLIVLVLSTFN